MKRTTTPLVCLFLGLNLAFRPIHADPPGSSPTTSVSPAATTPTTTASPAAREGLTSNHEDLWNQDLLTGDWGGFRKTLENDGLKISPTYIGEVFANPSGGASQGIIADGVFNVALDFNLERMTEGDVEDLTIHANAYYIYGSALSAKYVGDFSNTSNISGYNSVRLQELWLQKSFWEKRITLKVGNIAIDTEYFQSSSASLFLNGTFGTFTLIANNIADAPVYPVASPGVRVQFLPTSATYAMAGVFSMDLDQSPATDDHYGTHFAMNGHSGLLVMTEAGYLLNQSPNDRGLQGTYRLGSFVETSNYNNWNSQARAALGTGSRQSDGADFGLYGVADQQIYTKADSAISVFVRGGGAPSNVNFVDRYAEGGFDFTGFIPGRANDVAGIAAAWSHVSGEFSDSQVLQGNAPYTSETVVEATYKAQIAPWWSIQPDFQYILNPSGEIGSHNAVVLGLRTNLAF